MTVVFYLLRMSKPKIKGSMCKNFSLKHSKRALRCGDVMFLEANPKVSITLVPSTRSLRDFSNWILDLKKKKSL